MSTELSNDPSAQRASVAPQLAPSASPAPARSRFVAARRALCAAAGLVLLSACPGSLDNKDDFIDGSTVCDAPATILGPRCATSNCHDAEDPVSGLDLTPDAGLVGRLSGVPGTDCPDGVLIDTTSPEESLLLTKCQVDNTCNARMPITGAKLTQSEEQCLIEWLSSL